ncbi:MAG: FAD-dependent oxidoreductase [Rhodospirillales bacterium]|jgi:2,4-dienoyl-CoA reductase-like NADH-dependent reductase (Old Yellow Enzyme family)|nr:FAD-dependent oxidoreductase [Rhodospirillales bacterium]
MSSHPVSENDPLLQPFQLKHLSLRNRIVSTAHAPSFAEDGHPRDQYRIYHEEKAKGGLGLTMIGGSTNIAPDSPSVFGQLYVGDDSIVPWFQKLTNGVHRHGAGIMCQITHMGRRTSWDNGHWLPVLGPSGTRERAHRSFPKTMEAEDIRRVISDFVKAAQRCKDGGFDGIELLSHSHLLGQFMSPLVNRRDDDYGGSLDNRLRLTLQVLEEVREIIGPDLILGVRMTGDEQIQGGMNASECEEVAKKLEQSGTLDFLNVLAGAPYDDLGLAHWVSPMGLPSAPHLDIAGCIRKAVELPIIHAGGIADIATARHAVRDGLVDLVGMTRAHMADPYLVEKLTQGKEDRIRPCVGLGYCVDRVNQGKQAVCGHNAVTGREAVLPQKIMLSDFTKTIVVVGGGPAGMEAARVSAERGHRVILFEASDRLGGQLALAAKGHIRQQIFGVTDWLASELDYLDVDVRMNTYAEADDVLAENPDVVIAATGGWPEPPEIEGGDLAISSWDVLSGAKRLSGDVLLYDEAGQHAAAVTAEVLSQSKADVLFISPDREPLTELGPTTSSVAMRSLYQSSVHFEVDTELVAIKRDGGRLQASLRNILTTNVHKITVDNVVVELGITPMDGLYFELKQGSSNLGVVDMESLISGKPIFPNENPDGGFILVRIGDAVAGRNIHSAIYDAMRFCAAI